MKLSIITINYNNSDGLRKTIDSIMCQTWRDFEWLIIDGSSSDDSKSIIEQVASKSEANVSYWCSEPDKGVYNAMNKGIAKAKGEYILFMNSGDCIAYPSTLQDVFDDNQNADILFGYMMRKTLDGVPHNIPSMKDHLYWEDFYFDTLPHQSSYIKRELFDKIGGYDESYPRLADWKWFVDAVVYNHASVLFLHEKLSVYECGGISEDEHWKDDLYRLRDEKYPAFIPLQDLSLLKDLRVIMENRWSLFFFKVLRRIVYKVHNRKVHNEFKRIRFHD